MADNVTDNNNAKVIKSAAAGTFKWNTLDRLMSQVLYAVTGIILANLLSREDFGLVGALLIFQAFATSFVDSGFSSALLQKKNPTPSDYTTVFWFNLAVSVIIYLVLYLCAPLIARIFQDNRTLIPLSKVMFLTFIFNALSIVQTVRLMKRMRVKMLAIANMIALTLSGAVGIALAFCGYGAWAIVWQSVTNAFVKSFWLWCTGKWWPKAPFSLESLKSIWRLAFSVFASSNINIFFLHLYSFVIGAFYSLQSLGIYTQADKWSKMGHTSLSQIFTATFIPILSKYQDDRVQYHNCIRRLNRLTTFIILPVLTGLAMIGTPLFHTLFDTKWDDAIILFQVLCIRGIFIVANSMLFNYILGLGYGKRFFILEVIKDVMTVAALLSTVWFMSLKWLVIGQLIASAIALFISMIIISRAIGYKVGWMLGDYVPFILCTLLMVAATLPILYLSLPAWLTLIICILVGAATYIICAAIGKIPELPESWKLLIKP